MSNDSAGVVPEWTVGDRMVKARTITALSQAELAEYLGMSRVTLSRYETGVNRPPLTVLRLWAMRCGVPLDWLRYGDTEPLPDVIATTKKQTRRRKSASESTGWLIAA